MSTPAQATIAREKDKLWITDAELIRWFGLPEKKARALLRELDNKPSGFPKKQKLYGDRRYRRAVLDYFDRHYGGTLPASQQQRGSGK